MRGTGAGKGPFMEEQPGSLRELLKLRLDLAEVIRSVMELFREAKDSREQEARRLLSRLAEDRLNAEIVDDCIERAMALLAPESIESCAREARAGLGGDVLLRIGREWEIKMQQIETECQRIVDGLRSRLRSELPVLLGRPIAEHYADVRDSLSAQIDSFLAGPKKSVSAQGLQEIAIRASNLVNERRRRWISARQGEFVEALWALAAEALDQLERLYGEALDFAAAQVGIASTAKWTISKDEVIFSWRSPSPFEWDPRFAWELDILPTDWVRRKVRRDYCRTLETAATAYRQRIDHALVASGGAWASRLGSIVQDRLKELDASVRNVFFSEATSIHSGDVDKALNKLEVMRQELTGKAHDRAAILSSIPVRHRAMHRCLICERIEAELFDFFGKRQYESSTNEAGQREPLSLGGFCPLHTWQYARITSVQGISLTYAPLVTNIARDLYNIASSASSTKFMRDAINRLLPSTENCPACRKTVEVEESSVEEFRKMSISPDNEEADIGLCIPHLAAVLNREADLEASRRLVLEQASVLNRIAEDMQTYSLKHDALRRELTTDEELLAYLFALSLLVGHRSLSTA
ncbi:MAG: hypothetical protein A4E57_00751 [Syntrophorhabdaceae bacterium PtaU1.Bin034]|nr:MAG: hypothetical protein A4E57_00751 [Syntrophorhabdaceae bacterium PtaU1.Bin034]